MLFFRLQSPSITITVILWIVSWFLHMSCTLPACVSIAVVWTVVIFLLCMGILKVPHHWCAWVFWKYPITMSILEMFCPHLCCLIYYTSICHLFKKIIIIRMFCVWCDSFPSTSSNSCFHRYDQYKWYNSVAVT